MDLRNWTWWPAWLPCSCGTYFLCRIHQTDTADCDCAVIEEWTTDPYETGGPTAFIDEDDMVLLQEAQAVREIEEETRTI